MTRKTVYVSGPIVLAFILVWLVLAVLLSGIRFPRASDGEFRSIKNEQFNFSVTYSSEWRAHTYGEGGFRGRSDVKLRIFQTQFGSFEISVSYKPAHEPTLQDVAAWGAHRIEQANERLRNSGGLEFEAHVLTEDEIDGVEVLRRSYSNERIHLEEVYIARATDMIILRLDSDKPIHEKLPDEFNQIVESIRPLK